MNHYKLREGESIRKPVVKRDRIVIRVPVLLLCLALAFLVWLYVVSISKINSDHPPVDTAPATEQETTGDSDTSSATDAVFFCPTLDGADTPACV